MELIEKELTYAIKGCFFAINNQVGWGMEEEAYHQGLQAFDVGRVRTYLRHMNLNVGVVANFGKDRLQVIGLRNERS